MEFVITVPDEGPRAKALVKAIAAYNARNPILSGVGFLQLMLGQQLDELVRAYLTTTISPLEFLARFTTEERIAVHAAAESDATLEDFLQMIQAAEKVDLTRDDTIAGVQSLEAASLIAQGRAAEILSLL